MDVIAEYRLHLKYPDGEVIPVRLRLGRPVELPTGNWECPAEIEGDLRVHYSSEGLRGAGAVASNSWQALAFALRLTRQMLGAEVRGGAAMYSATGRHPLHVDELFPIPRDWERPPPEAGG